MKRVVPVLFLLLLISIIAVYFLISSPLKIVEVAVVPANSQAAFRVVSNPKNWLNWVEQPGSRDNKMHAQHSFILSPDTFTVKTILDNAIEVSVTGDLRVNTFLSIMPVTKDTCLFSWKAEIETGLNPVTRIQRYRQALKLKKNLSALLNNINDYVSKPEHLYGSKFTVTPTNDTLLVAKKVSLKSNPNTNEIYQIINQLQQLVAQQGGRQTAPPMVNITEESRNAYQVMVALPVNKNLTVTPPFLYRKMVKGNFLVTEVQGGNHNINQSLEMMERYINEYGKTVMAIPFQVLVTDRLKETDSSKWITKIYYPVL